MLFFKKINAGLSLKLIFSGLVALTLFSTFSSCHIYNLSLEDFLKEWTETARVAESRISPEPVYKDSYAHIASGEDTLITYKLVNPQNYDLKETFSWETENSPASGTDYYLEWDANDKNILYLTLKKDFLEGLDGKGTKISPSLTLTEPKSKRTFGTYSVPALVNSAPPAVILPVVLRTDGDVGDETYVICFNLPEMTGIHQDVKTLEISSPYKKTYTITPDGNLSGGEAELTTKYDKGWQPVKVNGAKFIGDEENRFVGIVTNVPLSGDLTSFTLSLVDEYGLSTSVTASTQASKLPPVTASLTGGIITINGTVRFSNLVSGATLVLESNNWEGVKRNDTEVSGNIEGAGPITLTFTKPGTYNITAYAQMNGAAASDKITFTYKVVDDSTVYVSDTGDDNNLGTEDKPVATLQRALDLLNEARFTEGKIVVTGTVQTEEVKINAPGDTTGSVTKLTVMGGSGSAGGTLENKKGRVFTIGTGGSLTLEENITLTGTVTNGNGGAVYVNGGTFTMEAGSKITRSSASYGYGGGVYVDSEGTFTMGGGTISKNSASNIDASGGGASGGGVCISDGTFTMSGTATLQGNMADRHGGGVYIFSDGIFTMKADSKITDGQAAFGGGVYVADGSFTMSGTATLQGNEAAEHGGGVHILSGGIFTMNGGTIGGTAANTATYGGGVFVSGGTFDMNNGTISGNSASGSGASGGGVCISDGEFTMSGDAVISKNTAGSSGGGVFVSDSGKFTMEGGTIGGPDNFAQYGGGVYVNGGEFEMTGTAILQGNVAAEHGGGVYIHNGTFTMSGRTISGNKAAQNGGGVYVGDGTFTMTGGTISANNASVTGGGVYVSNTGSFTLGPSSAGSSPVISGNTGRDTSHNNVYLYNDKTLSITGKLQKTEDSGNIGISMATLGEFTLGWDSSGSTDPAFFFSDDGSYKIKLNSSSECELVTNDSEVEYKVSGSTRSGTFAEAVAAVNTPTGGTITLLKNIDGINAVFGNGNDTPITFTGGTEASPIILDLNGFTINRGLDAAQANGSVIKMSGGVLTIRDSSVSSTGTITGGNSTTNGGGIFIENNGSLTLENGSITGNKALADGGGVYFSSNGTFTMSGGSIESNSASVNSTNGNGGGVYFKGGTFTMSGTATIEDNKAVSGTSKGCGIYLDGGTLTMTGDAAITGNQTSATDAHGGGIYLNSGTFNMIDGEITDNKAGRGGGVYFPSKADVIFNLGDSVNPDTGTDPVIRNNKNHSDKPNNVFVEFGAFIEIVGALFHNVEIETENNIGITKENDTGKFAENNGHSVSVNDFFSSDQDGYIVDSYRDEINISQR